MSRTIDDDINEILGVKKTAPIMPSERMTGRPREAAPAPQAPSASVDDDIADILGLNAKAKAPDVDFSPEYRPQAPGSGVMLPSIAPPPMLRAPGPMPSPTAPVQPMSTKPPVPKVTIPETPGLPAPQLNRIPGEPEAVYAQRQLKQGATAAADLKRMDSPSADDTLAGAEDLRQGKAAGTDRAFGLPRGTAGAVDEDITALGDPGNLAVMAALGAINMTPAGPFVDAAVAGYFGGKGMQASQLFEQAEQATRMKAAAAHAQGDLVSAQKLEEQANGFNAHKWTARAGVGLAAFGAGKLIEGALPGPGMPAEPLALPLPPQEQLGAPVKPPMAPAPGPALPPAEAPAAPPQGQAGMELPGGGVMRPTPPMPQGEQTITPVNTPVRNAAESMAEGVASSSRGMANPIELATMIARKFPDVAEKTVTKMVHAAVQAAQEDGLAAAEQAHDTAVNAPVKKESNAEPTPILEGPKSIEDDINEILQVRDSSSIKAEDDLKRAADEEASKPKPFAVRDSRTVQPTQEELGNAPEKRLNREERRDLSAVPANESEPFTEKPINEDPFGIQKRESEDRQIMSDLKNEEVRGRLGLDQHAPTKDWVGTQQEADGTFVTRNENGLIIGRGKTRLESASNARDRAMSQVPGKAQLRADLVVQREVSDAKGQMLGLDQRGVEPTADDGTPLIDVRTTPRGTTIFLNDAGQKLLNDISKPGSNLPAEAVGGTTFRLQHLKELERRLAESKDPNAPELRASVMKARREGGLLKPIKFVRRASSMNTVKQVVRHEENHVRILQEKGLDFDDVHEALVDDPLYAKAYTSLMDEYSEASIPMEVAAYVVSGEGARLGLSPAQSQRLYGKLLDATAKAAGSASKAVAIYEQSHPSFKGTLDELRKQAATESESRTSGTPQGSLSRTGAGSPGVEDSRTTRGGDLPNRVEGLEARSKDTPGIAALKKAGARVVSPERADGPVFITDAGPILATRDYDTHNESLTGAGLMTDAERPAVVAARHGLVRVRITWHSITVELAKPLTRGQKASLDALWFAKGRRPIPYEVYGKDGIALSSNKTRDRFGLEAADVDELDIKSRALLGVAPPAHPDQRDLGFAQRPRPSIDKHLTPDESIKLKKNRDGIYEAFDSLPQDKDVEAFARRGAIARYWYENSANAIKKTFGDDGPKFAKLLAALSPQTTVRQNLRTALDVWNQWEIAGRPTDDASIAQILDDAGERLEARTQNATRVLTDSVDDLSGPKVRSFYKNLINESVAVTNDVWMARFSGIAQEAFGGGSGGTSPAYLALSAKVRRVASSMSNEGWNPQQIQAATWALTKATWELGVKGKDLRTLLNEINPIKAEDVADFARIMVQDPESRSLLDEILKLKGSSVDKVEASIAPRYGKQDRTSTKISEGTLSKLEAGVAEARSARGIKKLEAARERGQESLGFDQHTGVAVAMAKDREYDKRINAEREAKELAEAKATKQSINDRRKNNPPLDTDVTAEQLIAQHQWRIVKPEALGSRAFIHSDGAVTNIHASHAQTLTALGHKVGNGHEGDDYDFMKPLEKTRLIRVQKKEGNQNTIGIQISGKPTTAQVQSIIAAVKANKGMDIAYSYARGGNVVTQGIDSLSAAISALRKVYPDVKLSDIYPGERGAIRIGGGKPVNPLSNDPKYKKIFDKQHESEHTSIGQALKNAASALNEGRLEAVRRYVNRWIDVKKVVEDAQKRGVRFTPGQDPYISAQLEYGGGSGWAEATLIDSQRIVAEAEKLKLRDPLEAYLNIKGSKRAIQVIKEKIATARAAGQGARANRLAAKLSNNEVAAAGYSEPELAQALNDLQQNNPGKWNDIKRLAREEFKHNRDALDAYHDEGIISDELHTSLTNRGDEYINMSRIVDLVDEEHGHNGSTLTLRKQHGIKELKGSELINVSPFKADVEHRALIYRDISRNRASRKLIEFGAADPQGFGTVVRKLGHGQTVKPGESSVTFYDAGKPVSYAVPDVIGDALQLASENEVRLLGQSMLGLTARMFRAATTGLNLGFAIPNLFRDYADTRAFIGKTYRPDDAIRYFGDIARAINSIVRKDDNYLKFLRSGAAYSTLQKRISGNDFLDTDNTLGKGMLALVASPVTAISKMNNVVEEMGKVSAYNYQLRNGVNPVEAASLTRTFAGTPDVGNAGNMGPSLNQILMFFTSGIKGVERSFLFMKQHPKKLAALAAAVALRELILNRHNASFESPENDGTSEWEHVSDNDKKNYYVVLTPFTQQTSQGAKRLMSIKIPRPHFLGKMLGGPMFAMWEGVNNQVDIPQDALDAASNIIPGQVNLQKDELIGSTARGVVSSLNPALQEPIEQATNTETFGNTPIIPERMKARTPVYQFDERTSPTAVKIGKLLDSLGATGPITSPKRIEHAVRGATSGAGEMVTSGLDYLQNRGKETYPFEGTEMISRLPVIGSIARRFVGSTSDQKQIDSERSFYKLLDGAEEATTTLSQIYEQASLRKEILNRYKDLPEQIVLADAHPELGRMAKTFSDIREYVTRTAKDPKLSDKEKKDLIRTAHLDYTTLLKSVKLVDDDVKAASKLTLDQKMARIAGILSRNKNLNPEPDTVDEETK